MCILIFPSKIWAKKHTLYMAKYGSLSYKSAFDPHLDWLVQALRTESAEWPV